MKSGIIAALAGLLLTLPFVVAVPVVESCDATVDAALAEFATYDYNVPYHVARVHINQIVVACADPSLPGAPSMMTPDVVGPGGPSAQGDVNMAAIERTLNDLGVGSDPITCSGGSSTITGWSNVAYVANKRVHILNEPASSYYTIVFDDSSVLAADGHTRSTASNFEMKTVDGEMVAYWDWLNIPMVGTYSVGWRCFTPTGLITSVSVALSGSPPLVSGDVLRVESDGTTCLIPC